MPIYEYACGKCGHEFEVEQRITDDPVKSCPACRSRKVKRLISKTAFVLKGGGWYSDLYASPSGKDKKDKESPAEGAEAKDAGDKSEKKDAGAKPDEKPAKKDAGKGKKAKGKQAAA